ncbi:hypothetical protein [Streptomyces sp. NRRL S-350]|uniref:hypothetical protein n=1 Tax=Streptomyces sp. NRRL S-350 TaxID=1463902 RepID=UPI0004BEED9B|nr:hypothetical protein [Streptomyces sp. NRRL S-350]
MAAATSTPGARIGRLAERGSKAAAHFGLTQPDWAEVGRRMRRPGLRALTLAAAIRLVAAAADLDRAPWTQLERRMLAVDRAEIRLVRYLRLYALPVPSCREGLAPQSARRFAARLDGHLLDLDTTRRDEGVATLARLGLGLVHHLVHATNLPV